MNSLLGCLVWSLDISGVFVGIAMGLYAQCVIAPLWAQKSVSQVVAVKGAQATPLGCP